MVAGTEATMRTRSLLETLTLASILTLAPSIAEAAPFGEKGDVSFAADRLTGVYTFSDDMKLTAVGLFAPPTAHPYMVARLGVDFFPINHLSIGGSFAFWDYDFRRNGSSTAVLFSPRIGYAIDFSNSFGFWPRGGVTFLSGGGDEFALTLEAMFYAAPAQHFAFTFGPVLDVEVAAPRNNALSFGILTAGILGWI
jgi:hypothetical protein